MSHVQAIQLFPPDDVKQANPSSKDVFSSHVFHQIVAFSTKLPHIKNCPGWKRRLDFIENTLTGSQVITKSQKACRHCVEVTIDNDLMLHLGITYLRLRHKEVSAEN